MLIYNALSKHLYSRSNCANLQQAIETHGWASGEFAGASQWRSAGRKIRSGEQGVPIVILASKTAIKDGRQERKTVRKTTYVFNSAQTETDLDRGLQKPVESHAFQRDMTV